MQMKNNFKKPCKTDQQKSNSRAEAIFRATTKWTVAKIDQSTMK